MIALNVLLINGIVSTSDGRVVTLEHVNVDRLELARGDLGDETGVELVERESLDLNELRKRGGPALEELTLGSGRRK